MIYPRTKLIESLSEKLLKQEYQLFCIYGASGIGKTKCIELAKKQGVFPKDTLYVEIKSGESIEKIQDELLPSFLVIDFDDSADVSSIRTFIESKSYDGTIVFTDISLREEEDISYFLVPGISFREYAEGHSVSVDIGEMLTQGTSSTLLGSLRDEYIHLGQFPQNIINPENIDTRFSDLLSIMNQELFEKEQGDFLEFIRTVALGVGDLFKEERIAKLMNISRRKVRKYTEIILHHRLVHAVGPYVENPETELSRHVKLYFNDLSYMVAALGVAYYHGATKQGIIENFILLELERKTSKTHDIRFFRKKSGAEIAFILIEKVSGKITPIEVTQRRSDTIPQSIKSFDESYREKIERYMILNEDIAKQSDYLGKPLMFLPHIAI